MRRAVGRQAAMVGVVALVVLWGSPALAGGFLVSKIGGDTAGPMAASPSSLFWNPAAIGLLEGTHGFVDANFILRRASFTRDTTADGGQKFATSDMTALSVQPMTALTTDLSTDWLTVGLGIYAPFGSRAEWDDAGGEQRWQSIFGGITSIYATPALVLTPIEGLHIGGSVSYVFADVVSYRALDLGSFTDAPPEEPGNEGRVLLDFSGNTWSWALGAAWTNGTWTLGASYTSKVDIELDGNLSIYGPRNDFYQNLLGGDLEEPAELSMTWPRAIRAGVAFAPTSRWTFRLSTEWVQWSLYDEVLIDVANDDVAGVGNIDQLQVADWHDTVNVRAGGRYQLVEGFSVFGGGGWENGAIPDERLGADLFDSPKFGIAGGFLWQLDETLLLTAGYTHIFFVPIEIDDSAVTPPPTGRYTSDVGFLNTNLTWRIVPHDPP